MGTPERPKLRDASLETGAGDRSKADELSALLDAHQGEHHIIVLQSFPDPDAISSALAHKMIAARHQIESDIAYDGIISHHENVALVELLDIPMVRINGGDDLKRYTGSIFIDTQGTTSGLTQKLADAGVHALAIVDHHEVQGIVKADFTDIRDIGATATIYTEYLQSGLLKLEQGNESHARLATALMHGIRSETGGMIHAGREEFLAASYLAEFIDQEMLDSILSVKRSHTAMNVIKNALETRTTCDNFSIAGVGYLRYEDRDAIPQAADFLLMEENVHTTIVYGIVSKEGERELIIGSLRTKKPTLNPDTFLKETLGGAEPGRFYGGGRRGAGGFEIPIGFLAGSTGDEKFMHEKWHLYDEQIRRKLLNKLGLEPAQPVKSG